MGNDKTNLQENVYNQEQHEKHVYMEYLYKLEIETQTLREVNSDIAQRIQDNTRTIEKYRSLLMAKP